MKCFLQAFLAFAILLNAAPAGAATAEPAMALRAFFTSVDQKDYASAWSDFTGRTQNVIVNSVARDEHMDAAQVRALFDANDSRVDSGFWESFRTSSTAGKFAADKMSSQVAADGSSGSVQVFSGGKSVTIKMHLEGGAWKVGWMETFFPQRR